MTRIFDYNGEMEVSLADAKAKFSEMIRRVEDGEEVIITRHGRAVATLARPKAKGKPVFGTARGKIKLSPDWDQPLPLDMFDALRDRRRMTMTRARTAKRKQ
jgi:antitoxin (DNA-binding transcriptional repressor) of toxin-antitoxin stability system